MFLVDKKSILRFDDVRANDKVHRKGDSTSFEEKITQLLAEPGNLDQAVTATETDANFRY